MQWKFGASSVKPTGLLACRLPFFLRDLYTHALPHVQKPATTSIGLGQDGQFRTACHKEYPEALSAGIAHAIEQELQRSLRAGTVQHRTGPAAPARDWLLEVAQACTEIREQAIWLPDFQPQEIS